MTPLTALLGLVVGVCFIIYRWSTYTFDFWQKRNVVGPQPTALLGNYKAVLFGKMSFGQWLAENYQNYSNAPIVGVFKVRQPIAIIRDPDLIKHVLMRDFIKFPDRGKKTFEKAKPLSQHLLNLDYPKWKPLRNQFSPAFNPRKLREMFLLLCECGDHFQDCLEKRITTEDMIDCHDLTACFTTDVIGTCAFGLQMQAIADKQSVFRNMGKYILDMDWKKLIKFRIKECMPWFYSFLAPVVHDSMVTDFFSTIMKETIDHRRRYNVDKHDIIHQIMEIQDHLDKFDFKITDTLLAAQLFGFFLGGFETSSTTMSNALYELAQNHDCQNQLRDEIRQVLDSNDNVLTYDLVKSMTYLDKVFKETLRKYPAAMRLVRRSNVEYTFACGVTIPKDTLVLISVLGIHHDPNIYPDPDTFDPERFTKEAVAARHRMSYLPFGDGPRNCIGKTFAYHQTKVGLIKVLERFRVDVCERTEIPYKTNPRSGVLQAPLNGIYLRFSKI